MTAMTIVPETSPKHRIQFSLRTMLVAMAWVALFCAVRAMVFRNDFLNGADVRATWGGMFLAIVASAWGSWSARRGEQQVSKILIRGTLRGSAAAMLFVSILVVEVAIDVASEMPTLLQSTEAWHFIAQLVFYNGMFCGAVVALPTAMFWLLRPAWRVASLTSVLLLAAIGWQWLASETSRAREERETLERIDGLLPIETDYLLDSAPWFDPGPSVVGELRRMTREQVFLRIVSVRADGGSELSNESVDKNDWSQLPKLKSLRKVVVNNRGITDADLFHFAKLRHLEELWLNESEITDAGLEHLHNSRSLKTVALTGTKVTPTGEARLKQVLPQCTIEHRSLPPASDDPDAAPAMPAIPAAPP